MASVGFSNLQKSFAGTQVIRNINIQIEDGEFAVLVGPSGCGKSTLLRMLAGLEEVTYGQISIDGQIVNDVDSKDRDIAMVFQSYALYPHMTVEENMGFSLLIRKVALDVRKERVELASRILALDTLLKRYPRELSGGQRQRVAMGRAIVRDPKVFLFDEPLSNLDAKLRVSMRAEIKSLHKRLQTTTVYVTHDQVEAMTLADRIVVMNNGIVEQIGKPLEIYDLPVNLFVAQFIGSPSMNIIYGEIKESAGRLAVVAPDGSVWPIASGIEVKVGLGVAYGVRPEHLQFVSKHALDAVEAIVDNVDPTGAVTEVVVKVGASQLTVAVNGRTHVSPGETVHIAAELHKSHVFDAVSTERIGA
jgi:multiple sugar transport system ATP-binding protein